MKGPQIAINPQSGYISKPTDIDIKKYIRVKTTTSRKALFKDKEDVFSVGEYMFIPEELWAI